ncbi:MAG: glutamate--tRNA ligase [Planctomycetes bacterium]|nr:glutamate--tRNA ligase [Planctomycetota bacterium]
MSANPPTQVRVRFAPSPTGYLHIGGARTVLFNWLIARRTGGAFVLRIEDTDQQRNVADSVQKILDDLTWLGLAWDEGPVAAPARAAPARAAPELAVAGGGSGAPAPAALPSSAGPHGPYFQSQRLPIYDRYLDQLLECGAAYYALESTEELEAARAAAKAARQSYKYRRPDPPPTVAEGRAARAAGRLIVVRFKMPDRDITVTDDILGNVTLTADQLEDFVIQKSDGFPTYHFACVVDDALMQITHVLRGQEHLMNTPKHLALQRALGFPTPRYAHLPVIFNMDGSKMSKRDKEKALAEGRRPPEIEVHDFRLAGYLPEAIVNFIALLGWSPGDNREYFSAAELIECFRIERVGKTNARFDREKLLAFNTHWATRVTSRRLLAAFRDFLAVNHSPIAARDDAELDAVLAACAGFRTFADVLTKAGFLFVDDAALVYDPKAVRKVLAKNGGDGYATLEQVLEALRRLPEWSPAALQELIDEVCRSRGAAMGSVAQPMRVAVSGGTISPAIVETLLLLGRERTLTRLERCLSERAPAEA